MSAAVLASRIRVTGIVQGVGFRPYVWRLAQELNLFGWVRNDAQGVDIFAQGAAPALDELLARLRSEAPVLSRVDQVSAQDTKPESFTDFTILASRPGQATTAIGPDVGTCPDCLAELLDPADRRWRHAFITCTHCGPRYTVTSSLPYDRPQTSLAPFPLCPSCEREYTDPADRRFHAETTCCPACGPRLSLCDALGQAVAGDSIAATLALLQSGAIVAIKGLGGFHLACDARHVQAVGRLRLRKNREAKPFALMLANVASLLPFMHVNAAEQALLEGRERPIVLLRTVAGSDAVFPGVAPGLLELGVMLPCTPIQYLLFHEAAGRPAGTDWLAAAQPLALVMTSANPGGEPIVRDGAEARARLAGIADALLDHDRAVVARCDDSVLRAQGQGFQFIRRSRGYAPAAVRLPKAGRSVLAFGSHLKNVVCVTRGDQAFLSPYVGDLDNAATCDFLDETVQRMLSLFDVVPEVVAHDLHPDDYSTRAALEFGARHGLPTVAVQHHHAHIAAVCAEHGYAGPVLGLALDGVGLGSDGAAWGGELLQVHGSRCERLGHLRPLPLPGGDRAAREPWRMAAAVLHEAGRGAEIEKRFGLEGRAIAAMLAKNLNCPRSSGMGRVFDAAAGLLGLCTHIQYEAQAAMLLEQAAGRHIDLHGWPEPLPQGWAIDGQNCLDLLPLLASLDGAADVDRAAAVFHATLVAALSEWVNHAIRTTGVKTLSWGGGCWLNSLLSSAMQLNLEQRDLKLLKPVRSPPGDGAIALGQAWVAMHQQEP